MNIRGLGSKVKGYHGYEFMKYIAPLREKIIYWASASKYPCGVNGPSVVGKSIVSFLGVENPDYWPTCATNKP